MQILNQNFKNTYHYIKNLAFKAVSWKIVIIMLIAFIMICVYDSARESQKIMGSVRTVYTITSAQGAQIKDIQKDIAEIKEYIDTPWYKFW